MNDKAVYTTAPAPPGQLITYIIGIPSIELPMASLWEEKYVTKIKYKCDISTIFGKNSVCSEKRFTPKDKISYMDNICTFMTNCMSD